MNQTKRKSTATAATVNGANPKLQVQNSTDSEKVQAAIVIVSNARNRCREYGRNHLTPKYFQNLSCNSTERNIKEVCMAMFEDVPHQYNLEPLTREILLNFFELLALEYIAGLREAL